MQKYTNGRKKMCIRDRIWVEHDLMDPRTVSRKDMRGRVNNYMVNVMHAEPVDATLIDIDDEVTW